MTSAVTLLFPLLVLVSVLVSFNGYGRVITKTFATEILGSVGITTVFGFSILLTLSGFVELLHIGSAELLAGYLFLGLLFSLTTGGVNRCISASHGLNQKIRTISRGKIIAFAIASIYLLIYVVNRIDIPFNVNDDYDAYFIFAKRILEEGFQGGDPYNVRSIEQGFGAGSYLNALFLVFTPLQHIRIAEAGTGTILLILLVLDHIKLYGNGFWKILGAVMIACLVAGRAPIVNVSPMISGCALAYGILLYCFKSDFNCAPVRSAFLGLLLASFVLLKGNFLVSAVVIAATYYLTRLIYVRKSWIFFEAIVTLITMLVCLAPWMVSNLSFSGTAFYPILGLGVVKTGSFGIVDQETFIGAVFGFRSYYALMLMAWLATLYFVRDRYFRIFSGILILLTVTATVLLALTPAGILRYVYILLVIPIAFLGVSLLGVVNGKIKLWLDSFMAKYSRVLLAIVIMFITVKAYQAIEGNGGVENRKSIAGIKLHSNVKAFQEINVNSPQFPYQRTRIEKLQESIPARAAILLRVDMPFLFNFSRNRIYVMDWPGAAGPSPGTPYLGKPEDLAHYLRLNKIRYVAYSYGNEAFHSRKDYTDRLQHPSAWIRNLTVRTFAVQDQLTQLARDYKVLYDNGNDFVVDLCEKNISNTQLVCPRL